MAGQSYVEPFVAPTFGQRLGGRTLDGLLLLPVSLLLAIVLSGATLRVVVFVLVAAYEFGGVAIWGRTLGKKIVGTRVASFGEESLRTWQAAVRFATYGVPIYVCTSVGVRLGAEAWSAVVLLPVLRPPLHRGVHDLAAKTIVIPTTR